MSGKNIDHYVGGKIVLENMHFTVVNLCPNQTEENEAEIKDSIECKLFNIFQKYNDAP